CHTTREGDDGTYSMYVPLLSEKARTQNAVFHGKQTKHHQPSFSAKAVLCNANEDPPDKLYLAYYLFGGASARQQNAAFHEKEKHLRPQHLKQDVRP
ncbi:MAG: hypothetical protein K2O07_00820, partial [Alistipes sp.]|nr:hypothetical protein [Alistipes sp.]